MSLRVYVRRLALGVTEAALLAALASSPHAQAPTLPRPNNPPLAPHSIFVFPQRDFVSASGFAETDSVTVEVIHADGTLASKASNITPIDDPATPGFDGIVEVNHPGGACWEGVTPDIRAGDVVRTTAVNSATGSVVGDATTVADVTATRPVQTAFNTVEVHGTARKADGTPIDITQLEHRLVAPRDAFDVNGRRTLRANAATGTLSYDVANNPTGTKWTAVYAGLDAADVTRAVNAESRILWLGSNPAAGVENTVYEIGAGIVPGPAAPCTAPLEKLPPPPGSDATPPSAPANLATTVAGTNTIHLTWGASTDNVGVTSYGVYRGGVAIANVENPDGSAPAPTTFTDFNVPPGTYTYTVDAADAVGNRSGLSNAVAETATAHPAEYFPICNPQASSPACVNQPPLTPVQIIAFPARDFTSSSGYDARDQVTVQVIRNGFLISTASGLQPQDDPKTVGFDGTVEVNHPGGGCWEGVTPDLRPGDIVRQIAYVKDATGAVVIRQVDQMAVANITVKRPIIPPNATGTIEVHGRAMDANGSPIPLAQIEQRLVANKDAFDINGRRTLRAGGAGKDGAFTYDATDNPDGTKFTATYTGLDENDVYRAVGGVAPTSGIKFAGAESRVLFLGNPPAVAPEITIYENSDLTISGPAAGACTAPLELLDGTPPGIPAPAAEQIAGSTSVKLTWSPTFDDTYVNGYGIYRDGVHIANVGAVLPPGATTFTFIDSNVPPGDHTYGVDAVDSASPLKVNFPAILNDVNGSDPIVQGEDWGNRSAQGFSNAVTQPDILAPSVPTNVVGVAQANGVHLTWAASTDNVGVTKYNVYRDGTLIAGVGSGTAPAPTAYDDVNLAPGTYTYTVIASDAAGNLSTASAPATIVVSANADAIAPNQPANLTANTRDVYTGAAPAIGAHDVALSWSAATDNVGVAGYGIYRRAAIAFDAAATFTKIADVNGSTLTFVDRNVAQGTYDYTVDAVDSAANRSAPATAAMNVVTVNDPPQGTHSIIPFPARDFVSSTGYAISEGPVVITIVRGGKVWATSTPITPVEDPATPGLGAVEVNHPGGGCWDPANGGITPDVRPGDIVRFTNKAGKADQTTVANVWADRATDRATDGTRLPAGTVQTHGTAQDAAGKPLPLASVESRLVATSANPFTVNGRRVLRAGGAGSDGTFAYDPVGPNNPNGTHWTATFTGLTASDIDVAKAAESRAVWLGRDPLALTELTIFENGDGVVGGPAAGVCTAPAEAGPAVAFSEAMPIAASFAPGALTVAFPNQGTGTSATQTLVLTNAGSADAARAITGTLSVASAGLQFPSAFSVSSNTCIGVSLTPGSTCSVAVTYAPTVAGNYAGRLLFVDDANNSPVQVLALSGGAFDAQAPTVTTPTVSFATRSPLSIAANTMSATVTATATDASGVASMQLQQSTDGGRTWTALTASTGTTSTAQISAPLTLNLSTTYQFRAMAADTQGNASAWVVSSAVRTTLTDDSSGTPRFSGSWSTQRNNSETAGTVGSTLHIGTAPSAGKTNTVTFTFTGTEVALVSSLGPDRGQATISIDGGAAQTIDFYAAGAVQKAVVVASAAAASGTHTVTVSVLTLKNASSNGTRVDVDAFVVR